jgi:hypothetical protein
MSDDNVTLTPAEVDAAILAALAKLEPDDRERIVQIGDALIHKVKARQRGEATVPFSPAMAMELIARVGMWMNANPVAPLPFTLWIGDPEFDEEADDDR